ncbi:hypothetical protein [Sphingomonas sp. Leaf357]|uniref:hypothetical protein n=1 Tax=Sphingomonas sp. Leaf357 TaxID=1736350 RepID=UPI0012E2B097|nr:hypothetical protein [Sphingomonas sp. Leaf357]
MTLPNRSSGTNIVRWAGEVRAFIILRMGQAPREPERPQLGVSGPSAFGKAIDRAECRIVVESRHLPTKMISVLPMFTVRYSATISRNHISLTNTSTGETIARTASKAFSSEAHLISDQEGAASFAGDLIRQIEGRGRWLRIFPIISVKIAGEPLARQDFDDVRRLFHEQGFVRVKVK